MAINYPVIFKTDTSQLDKAGGALKKFGGIAAGVGAAAGAAIAGIAATSIKEFAKFDSALNKSISIMGDVSDTLQNEMGDAAKEVAKTTSFSAEEAAESYFFLASAGLDAAASIKAMPQVAKFAQAGMFDMALATDLATDAQSALGLASDDATENLDNLTRVTDVFVKANTLANTSVEQLATAFTTKAGNALKTVGKDVEEGAAALAVFADQGIKGERAGTLLTNTIFGLTDIMAKAPAEAEALGIEIFNAAGEMNSFADISEDLTTALSDMTKEQQIATLDSLGFTKQAREGTLALLGNSDALREYEEELRNAGGTTDEVAGKQLQTLEAQFGLLKDSINVVAIEIGEVLEPILLDLLEIINPIVDAAAPKFVAFFENIATGISGFISSSEGAIEKLTTIKDMFLSIRETSPENAVKFLGEQFGQLGTFITENLGEAFTNFMAFRQQLTESILEALPGIIDGILTFLPELITFLAEEVLPMIFYQLQGIATTLIEIFSEAFPQIVETIAELIPDILETLSELLPGIMETLLGFIPTLLETGLTVFESIVDALVEMIPQIIDTLVELLPKLIETLMDMLPDIISAGLDLFMGIVDALVDTIPVILDAIVEAMPEITGQLIEMLPDIIEASLELFFGIVTGLVESIPDILSAIIDMIPKITTQLIDMLPDLIEAGFDLFSGLIDGLIDATPEIVDAIIELVPKITTALIGEIPKLIEAGFELVKGIVTGIVNNAPRLIGNAMSEVGGMLVNRFKETLGIQSPSKVFMGLGEEVVNGLDEGIKNNSDIVKTTSEDLASFVRDVFDSTLTDVAGTTQEIMREGAKIQAQFGENGELLRSYTTSEKGMEAAIQDGQANFQRITNDINSLYRYMGETSLEGMQDIQDVIFGGSMQQAIDQLGGQVTLTNPETGMRRTIGGNVSQGIIDRAMAEGFTEALGQTSFTDEQLFENIQSLTEQIAEKGLTPFANGGIVTAPTAGLVGEAGAEAIIPLDRFDTMMGTQNTYNINVNAGIGTNGSQVGQEIVEEIIRYEKFSGRVFARA